jgi:hypothetical protein
MKNIVLGLTVLLFNLQAFGQCTPNGAYTNAEPGFHPDSISFLTNSYAEGGSAYSEFLTLKTIADTLVANPINPSSSVTMYIDAMKIESVSGLPAGFSYAEGGSSFSGGQWNNGGSGTNTTPVLGCLGFTASASAVSAAAPSNGYTDYPIQILLDGRISGWSPDISLFVPNGTWLSELGAIGLGSLPVNDYVIRVHAGCQPTYSTTIVSQCNNYTWNGATYTQSGTYTYQSTNAQNCDSIATLELTILPNIQEFESYTLCDGESVTVNGTTYTQAGQYTQVIPGNSGCDTVLTVDVQSETTPGISILGNTIIAANSAENYAFVNPGGYTITWSATNGTVINGQGTPAATIFWDAIGGGEVSVTLSNNNCSYTYMLAVGTFVGIENHWLNQLSIHPNPSTDIFNMELTEPTAIEVFDATGRLVLQATGNGSYSLDLSNEAEGVYNLRLQTYSGVGSYRIVKQ